MLARRRRSSRGPTSSSSPRPRVPGYFVEGGVRDLAVTAGTLARDLDAAYRATRSASRFRVDVVWVLREVARHAVQQRGVRPLGSGEPEILHVHRKNFLPTYGLFDEERFVERGHEMRAFDTPWGRAAILVCEDAWHSLSGTVAALDGAQLIFLSSAAPARGVWPRDDAISGTGVGRAMGAARSRHRRRAWRVRDASEPRRERGRQDVPRRVDA